MAAYDSYKDSGVKWLGKVPGHWEVKKLRAFFERRNQKVSSLDFSPLSVTKNGVVPQMENVAKSGDTDNRRLVKIGDFVINSRSDRKGSSGLSELEGSVSFVNTIMTPNNRILPKFCNYLLKSNAFVEENYRNGHGIVADLWTTSFQEQKSIVLSIPPREEQEAIVSYLDNVTAKIDEAIEAQQKMIDALNERKQIIITRAVTRNMDKWYKIPLRFVFEMRNGYTPSKADPSFWENGTIPWYRMEDIRKSGRFLNESIQTISPKAVKSKGTFKAGSYIMAICTASIGEHAMLIADSLANQRFMNFKVHKSLINELSPKFIFYYFYVIGKFCRDNANSTCFQYVDMAALKRYPIPVPSIAEQQDIVTYIEQATSAIDSSLSATEHRLNLLQERKQIIINEVVTGKKKVI